MHTQKLVLTRFSRLITAAVLIVLGCLHLSQAADSSDPDQAELITDRPDQTESSAVVPTGTTQLETGWGFSQEDEGGVRADTHEIPGSLVRIGLAERFELRVGWGGFVSEEVEVGGIETDTDGAADAEVGGKILLWGASPSAQSTGTAQSRGALLAAISLPVGEDDLSSDRVDPSFRVSVSHDLSDVLSLGYNLGMEWESVLDAGGDRDTLSDYIYTFTLGFGNVASRPRLGAFVELFGAIPASATGGPRHSFDGGFTYLLRPNLQLDLFAGLGLSDDADDWFAGTGLSVRFPR